VRLDAPDIALAEAAIGAGLTGVLLLDALRHIRAPAGERSPPTPERPPP
jgi:energy-converting hydrogenase B subunit D